MPSATAGLCWFSLLSAVQALPHSSSIMGILPDLSTASNDIRPIFSRAQSNSSLDPVQTSPDTSLTTGPPFKAEKSVFLTKSIIITLVLFLAFSAFLIVVFFYGNELRLFFSRKLRTDRPDDTETPKTPGLGFGFDGLTEAELEAVKWREEKQATRKFWQVKLPLSIIPPHSPLQTIHMVDEGPQEVKKNDETPRDEKCTLITEVTVPTIMEAEPELHPINDTGDAIQVVHRE